MQDLKRLLQEGAENLQIELSAHQLEQFMAYLQLIMRWNKTYNLTAVKDPKQIVIRHFLDSIAVAPHISGGRILDVGAGAGLPGIPLALLYPLVQFVLLDSNGKKTRFMQQVVAELNLPHVEVAKSRVELFFTEQKFDQIYSRAFSSIEDKIKNVEHLLREKGQIMALKGDVPKAELIKLAAQIKSVRIHSLKVPNLESEARNLIEIELL
ncbi:MAG: 16S rRNA (guanine(527)-N(7))-methyltransferase RsmG [Pseudomonadales bacterium]|nr:16S rRNA (guanine(527)-N(7))-methyltransferase RsmG [Pseudomonadales bacterium]